MDVGGWLRGLGLERHAKAFQDNDIEADVLPELTADDLIRLGIVSVGQRRRVLAAIAALRRAPNAVPTGTAERRLLTVMFCDLVDSTRLSSSLDPEEMREVIATYQRTVVAEIERFGGHVAKFMGDGILTFFGWPHAQEDATERAVLAGLGAVRAVALRPAPHGDALAARVGISAGLVVVGDLLGEGAAREESIVGETPNLAARLQAVAGPGEVVISESARRLVGGLFDLVSLGTLELKGFHTTVPAYTVRGEARIDSRFDAARGRRLTPLVGREIELAHLQQAWAAARNGKGRTILVTGEPGIGKSRLARTLAEQISSAEHTVLRYFCSPHHTGTALFPVIEQLRRAAHLSIDEPVARQLEKLESLLGLAVAEPCGLVPLFASLLSLPAEGGYRPPDLGPAALKARTLEALTGQLIGLANKGPVLVLFEDLHWLDPTTAEVVGMLADGVARLPVLLLATVRPGFDMPWPKTERFDLGRLDRRQSSSMLRELVGHKSLPEALEHDILAKTDGVPLFLEELTKNLLETGWLADTDAAYRLARPLPALDVPDTLQGSLMARLDRLPGPKNVAQIGAVIGRDFPHTLIAAVADLSNADLTRSLEALEEADLIQRRGEPPDAVYSFKHALVRDAAYESLLRSRRQTLHGRIVTAIESDFAHLAVSEPELLAQHCADAGLTGKAVGYWRQAGEQAVRRAGNREASDHLRRALAHNGLLPDTAERDRTELAILSQLGPALMSLHGWPATEVREVFERAGSVARRLQVSADLAPPLVGLWLYHLAKGQFDRADGISKKLFRIASELEDPDVLLQAHHAAWPTCFLRGRFTIAAGHIESAMALYDETRHVRHRYLYLGHDPAVCALAIGAVVQSVLGRGNEALRMERDVRELARRLQHAPSLAHTLWFVGEAQLARGDIARAAALADELLPLCEEHKLPQPRATALMFKGWALARSGETAAGLAKVEEGLAIWDGLGVRSYLPRALCLLAECQQLCGRHAEADDALNRGLAVAEESGEQWYVARLHALRGELFQVAVGDGREAEAALQAALGVAREQGARLWELCAAMSLTRIWLRRKDAQRARDLLRPVLTGFAPDYPSPYMREAGALLEACD